MLESFLLPSSGAGFHSLRIRPIWAQCGRRKPASPQPLAKPTALFPHPGNNGTFSQLWATAESDQNTNKEKRRGAREDCLVWKPAELMEECGIMKMAYLIIWYLKYVFLFPLSSFSSLPPSPPCFCLPIWRCRSLGPGGGYPAVSPRQTQPYGVSEEGGQPANTTAQQWVPHSPHLLALALRGASLSQPHAVFLFVCV